MKYAVVLGVAVSYFSPIRCTIVYQDLLCKRNCVKVFEFRSYLLTQENQNQINCRTYDKTDIRGTSQDYQFMLVSFLWITQTSLLLKDAS